MTELKTRPGVYVEEVTKLPPSVAQVETAIPAFIGYTQMGPTNEPTKIRSMLQYEAIFGKANPEQITLKETVNEGLTLVQPRATFLMYYSLQMYFANGGGPCYIVSVGYYNNVIEFGKLYNGLMILKDPDGSLVNPDGSIPEPHESSLIVFPDATSLEDWGEFYKIYQEALTLNKRNRFVILDIYQGNSITTTTGLNTIAYFRKGIDPSSYGAAYFPYLKTILNYAFDETTPITHIGLQETSGTEFYLEERNALVSLRSQIVFELNQSSPNAQKLGNLLAQAITIVEKVNETADAKINLADAIDILKAIKNGVTTVFTQPLDGDTGSFMDEFDALIAALPNAQDLVGDAQGIALKDLKGLNSLLYHQIKNKIASLNVVLPPSSTIAGIYAKVDSIKGVWKAPANIALNYVVAPIEKISDEEQKDLNVDPENNGKSINVIRNFTGKGNLVWGARTLESEDDKWRYIQVRRFFNMVEESLRNATKKFKGEPHDDVTWLRAKTMVENFLNQQWINGALVGSTPKEAYHVEVSYPKTMNDTDIAEGRMNIRIEMAVVRPAEFITLNFSCKL